MPSAQAIATVVAVIGQAWVRTSDGRLRELRPGDSLNEGEVIITAPGGQVELDFGDGTFLELTQDQTLAITRELANFSAPTEEEGSVAPDTIDKIIQALDQGQDIDLDLEAPAAGGGNEEGNSFVRLMRIVELTDPALTQAELSGPEPPPLSESGTLGSAVVTVSLTTAETAVEDDFITYTATLSRPALEDMRLTLNNGTVILIAAGDTSGTGLYQIPDDVYAETGEVTESAIITTAGGGFDSVLLGGGTVTAISDDRDVTTLTLSADSDALEEGIITYTVTASNPTRGDMTVTLDNGLSVTIADGETQGSVTLTVPDDVYAEEGETLSAALTGFSGGGFEAVELGSPVTTNIHDDSDVTTLTLDASANAIEEGTITYTATLSNPTRGEMTVTLDNGVIITIADGETSGSTSYTVPDDVYAEEGETLTATVISTSGGGFEALDINDTATTAISDDRDVTTLTLSADSDALEEGIITYTVTASNPTRGDMTVTLDNGLSITIPDGETSGSVNLTVSDDVYAETGETISAAITSFSGGGFEVVELGPSVPTSISDDSDVTLLRIDGPSSVAEGALAQNYTLTLDHPPLSDVAVTLSYSGTAINGTDFQGVTQVTIPAGSTTSTFSIPTINDSFVEGAESFTIQIVGASGGNFEVLQVDAANSSVTTSIIDNDFSQISISDVTVDESAGTATFTVSLNSPSSTSVSVDYSTSDNTAFSGSDYQPLTGSLTFAPGETSRTISVPIIDDSLVESTESFSVVLSSPVNATIADGQGIGTIVDDVNAANDPPIAVDDNGTTTEDVVLTVDAASGLLANDTDLDGDSLQVDASSVGTFATTAGGSITIAADGSYSYTPAANFNGADSFTYTVTDGTTTDVATLSLTVNAANDPPIAVDDNGTTTEDVVLTVDAASGLLANDTDLDGDSLQVDASSVGTFATTAGGSITIAADGSYSYTPAANFNGADSFTYTVTDGTTTDVATLSLTVNAANDPATIVITDNDPTGAGDDVVYEHGLTSAGDTTETVSNFFTVNAPDGVATLVVGGVTFTNAELLALATTPVTIDTGEGNLQLTGFNELTGKLDYTYTLKGALTHGASDLLDGIPISVTDTDGDTGNGILNIRIVDDVPVANSDLDTVLDAYGYSAAQTVTTGNILTGTDPDNSPGANMVADYLSADGPTSLTNVSWRGTTKNFSAPDGNDAGGNYLTFDTGGSVLKIYEDGNYTFTITDDAYGGSLYSVGSLSPTTMNGLWDKVSLSAFSFGASYTDGTGKLDLSGANGAIDYTSEKGIGVDGTQNGMPAEQQINHDSKTDQSEALVVDFGIEVISAKTRVSNIFLDELTGEIGKWEAFGADGVKVGEGVIDISSIAYVSTDVGDSLVELLDASGNTIPFQYLVFTALPQAANDPTDSSDYFVRSIDYRPIGELFTYTLTDADGDTSSANLFVKSRLPNPAIDPDPIWTPITTPSSWDKNDVGNKTYVAGIGDQAIRGRDSGSSTIYGDSDTNVTATGNDILFGYDRSDTLYGGGGNDQLNGGSGDDTIYGDSIPAGDAYLPGNDIIDGGSGNDTLFGDQGDDIIQGGTGDDVISAGQGRDQVYGGDGNDTIDGDESNDYLMGEAGNDIVRGGTGNDILKGGLGADTLDGGADDDFLVGGAGNDTLTGGIGVDVFRWELADRGTAGTPATDTVTDFDPQPAASGGDILDLRDLLQGEDQLSGNLDDYLHFEKSGSDTIVHVSSQGNFDSGYSSSFDDQTITLQNIDLGAGTMTDQQIIQDMLTKGKLITD